MAITVEDARIMVKGEVLTGLEAALVILKRGQIRVPVEVFGTDPGRPIFIKDQTLMDLKKHESFLSRNQRRRLKKYKAAARVRRREARFSRHRSIRRKHRLHTQHRQRRIVAYL